MIRTRIVSAFPGSGKTYYHSNNPETTLDSDSSNFSWIVDEDGNKKRNPDFPNNYINYIKENIGKYEFIFVSTHKEVRKALLDNCIFFYLIYPLYRNELIKDEFIQRYKDRNSSKEFIKTLESKWHDWTKECYLEEKGCRNICMVFKYLSDEINIIKDNDL